MQQVRGGSSAGMHWQHTAQCRNCGGVGGMQGMVQWVVGTPAMHQVPTANAGSDSEHGAE